MASSLLGLFRDIVPMLNPRLSDAEVDEILYWVASREARLTTLVTARYEEEVPNLQSDYLQRELGRALIALTTSIYVIRDSFVERQLCVIYDLLNRVQTILLQQKKDALSLSQISESDCVRGLVARAACTLFTTLEDASDELVKRYLNSIQDYLMPFCRMLIDGERCVRKLNYLPATEPL